MLEVHTVEWLKIALGYTYSKCVLPNLIYGDNNFRKRKYCEICEYSRYDWCLPKHTVLHVCK